MWSAVFLALSCVADAVRKSVKATGPLPGRGTSAHTIRGLHLGGRAPRPRRLPRTSVHTAGLTPRRRGPQDADISKWWIQSKWQEGAVLLTQGGQKIPESEQFWRRALARGADFDARREQIGEEM